MILDTGELAGYQIISHADIDGPQGAVEPLVLTGNATIDSISGWLYDNFDGVSNPLVISIYQDGGDGQSIGTQLYTSIFTLPDSNDGFQWRGLTGLGWALGPGAYCQDQRRVR